MNIWVKGGPPASSPSLTKGIGSNLFKKKWGVACKLGLVFSSPVYFRAWLLKVIGLLFNIFQIDSLGTLFPRLSLLFPNRPQSQIFHCRDVLSRLLGKDLLLFWVPSLPQVLLCWHALQGVNSEHLRTKGEKHYETWFLPGLCQKGRKQVDWEEAGPSLKLSVPVQLAGGKRGLVREFGARRALRMCLGSHVKGTPTFMLEKFLGSYEAWHVSVPEMLGALPRWLCRCDWLQTELMKLEAIKTGIGFSSE